MTTTESNGRQATDPHILSAPRTALPPQPRRPLDDTSTGTSTRSPGTPVPLGLADHDRRMRREGQILRLRAEAEHCLQKPVRHPDGGDRTVAETQADMDELRQQVSHETAMQSRKHHRLPRWMRSIPKFVLFFDFALLLYFFGGVTDVNWQAPLSIDLAFAAAVAGMMTVLAYGFLAFTGHQLQMHKTHAGTVHRQDLDGFTKATFGTAMTVITVLGALMFVRIRSEVLDALGARAGVTALVIPLAVAVVSAAANFLVVLIHMLDGSTEVARLDKLAVATRRQARKAHRLRRQAARQAHQ
jgi:hypothetical protein